MPRKLRLLNISPLLAVMNIQIPKIRWIAVKITQIPKKVFCSLLAIASSTPFIVSEASREGPCERAEVSPFTCLSYMTPPNGEVACRLGLLRT